jgi:hypothetical protein
MNGSVAYGENSVVLKQSDYLRPFKHIRYLLFSLLSAFTSALHRNDYRW